MSGVSRIGDIGIGTCCCHSDPDCRHKSGFIITGSSDANCHSIGLSRCSDIVIASCGHIGVIINGSNGVTTNGSCQTQLGATFVGCFTGVIITSCSDVISG